MRKVYKKLAPALIFLTLLFQSCQKDRIPERDNNPATAKPVKIRILYINSYDPDYFWSIGIMEGIFSAYGLSWAEEGEVTTEDSPVLLKIHHMRTLVDTSPAYIGQRVEEARKIIGSWKPDVVIASDDNASKYLIAPYYRDGEIPFVFCGLNWDIDVYGFPASNITGMISVHQTEEITDKLMPYAGGKRVTYLRSDDTTSDKEIAYLKENLPYPLSAVLVSDYGEWKREFLRLQDETDMILVGSPSSLAGWDGNDRLLRCFMLNNTKIPTGGWDDVMTGNVLLSIINRAQEQGIWAAEKALEIARGTKPSDIPVARNVEGAYYLNMELAEKMDVLFPLELIQQSHLVNNAEECLKIYYVNSYHEGYPWSDTIEEALGKALFQSDIHYELRIFRMDSKNRKSDLFIRNKAQEANEEINAWEPDIILGSDDNFLNYLVIPYLMDKEYPVLYCGLNGRKPPLPPHIKGMAEAELLEDTISHLRYFAGGERLGFLFQEENFNHSIFEALRADDTIPPARMEFAEDFEQWKDLFLEMQKSTDMLILYNPVGLKGWNYDEAYDFIIENTAIPVGTTLEANIGLALLGALKVPEEQGWWLGRTAAEILSGTAVEDVSDSVNTQSKLIINTEMANRLGLKIPMGLLDEAQMWPGEKPVP